jgi:hypothetical protein
MAGGAISPRQQQPTNRQQKQPWKRLTQSSNFTTNSSSRQFEENSGDKRCSEEGAGNRYNNI